MPTARPRHMLTETSEIADALDAAERRWPEVPRSQLLRRLVLAGGASLQREEESVLEARLAALLRAAGQFDECFEPGLRETLREEWPA